jgi:hypothetical protein
MKKILLSIAFLASIGTTWAQAPQSLNYQGVARNTLGVPMANQALGLRLTIHDGSSTGTVVYQETQTPTTNAFGLYNVSIGTGTVASGTFSAINWGTGTKFMQVEIDAAGGSAYVNAGTNELLSVPYSLYADKANSANNATNLTGTVTMGGDVTGTNAASNVVKLQGNSVSATAPAAGQVLTWNSGSSTWAPANLPASGTVTSITAGTGLSGGVITGSGTISMPNVGTSGTYGSATVVPAFTTDAQGRVTSVTNTPITGDNWGAQVVQTDATLTGSGTPGSKLSIASQGASVGQALEWNGSSWQPHTLTTYSAGTGMTLTGTTFDAQTTNALWNANELQGKSVSATTPTAGQVLTYNTGSGSWVPTTPAVGGSVTSITAGTGLSGGTITTSGTISLPNTGTAGTYGSSTTVPVITTDAQGRVTGVTNTSITAGGVGTVTSINTNAPLSGGPITSTGTISMTTSGVSAGAYGTATTVPAITVDAWGRITGASNTTISGVTPGGTAGGDLTGTYPNPTVAAGAITDAKVSNTAAIAYSKLSLTGHIAVADHSATGVPSATTFLRGDNTWSTPSSSPTGAAGGDLTGTYPNPTVAAGAITDAKVSATAAIAYSKLSLTGHIAIADHSATGSPSATTFLRGDNTWAAPTATGTAGGDLTGTYPNPTLAVSGVTAGTYGTATQSPTIVVDAKGRITSASNTTITTGVAGTTNYFPVFTSATALGNSIMYQNPAAANRIGINYGTTNHGLVALKSTGDTIGLYMNLNSTPGFGGYGFQRIEYTGPNDQFRVGILSTVIKSVADVNGYGIEGAANGTGVYGIAEASSTSGGEAYGVQGQSYYDGNYSIGTAGFGQNWSGAPTHCYGVYGYQLGGVAATSYAIYSDGNMHVNGAISKSSGTFKIDHPLDPANKYLSHSFVESPDMMNIYNGNITTDATGTATVTLPDYFEALNMDFRYQLTVIGTFAQAIISEKISGNKFTIKTSLPNVEVSWMVTGVRQDAWANAHRVIPEQDKASGDKGKYMHPELFGQPADMQIGTPDHKSRKNDPALISHGAETNK